MCKIILLQLFLLAAYLTLAKAFLGNVRLQRGLKKSRFHVAQEEVPISREDPMTSSSSGSSPLKQLQFVYDCVQTDSDTLSEFLFELGCLSVSCEVDKEKDYLFNDEERWADLIKTKNWKTAILRANFASSFDTDGLIEILKLTFPDTILDMKVLNVEDKDWVSHVQASWNPFVIDDLTVRFPWHSEDSITTPRQLVLEGGAAFGTGDHPTTRLCSRWLQSILGEKEFAEASVLDYGCGSAILGLIGLLYGARMATGVDIDRDALASAVRNCELNGQEMDFFAVAGDAEDSEEVVSVSANMFRGSAGSVQFPDVKVIEEKQYDIVVANILAPILVSLAPQLAKHTRTGGVIALSGVFSPQASIVIDAYSEYFADMKVAEEEEGWVVMTGTRK